MTNIREIEAAIGKEIPASQAPDTFIAEDLNDSYDGLCQIIAVDVSPARWQSTANNEALIKGLRQFATEMETVTSIMPGEVDFIGQHQVLTQGLRQLIDVYEEIVTNVESFLQARVPLEPTFVTTLSELVQDLEIFTRLVRSLTLLPTPDKDDELDVGTYNSDNDALIERYLNQSISLLDDALTRHRARLR